MDASPSPFIEHGDHDQGAHMHDGHGHLEDAETDAALAALRAAITAGEGRGADIGIDPALGDVSLDELDDLDDGPVAGPDADIGSGDGAGRMPEGSVGAATGSGASISIEERTDALSLLNHLNRTNTALIGSMNLIAVLQGLLENVKTLTENQQKQGEILQGLLAGQLMAGSGDGAEGAVGSGERQPRRPFPIRRRINVLD